MYIVYIIICHDCVIIIFIAVACMVMHVTVKRELIFACANYSNVLKRTVCGCKIRISMFNAHSPTNF